MAEILDGKELSKKIRKELKSEVEELKLKGINPKLAVILVGDDSASQVYVKNKSKACEKTGIDFEEYIFDANITEQELLDTIEKLNNEVENQGCYKTLNVEKIDKSKINMEVLNKIIVFKMLEIMRDNEMIDEREYAKIEKKRTQFGESVVKQNKLFKGGDLT